MIRALLPSEVCRSEQDRRRCVASLGLNHEPKAATNLLGEHACLRGAGGHGDIRTGEVPPELGVGALHHGDVITGIVAQHLEELLGADIV